MDPQSSDMAHDAPVGGDLPIVLGFLVVPEVMEFTVQVGRVRLPYGLDSQEKLVVFAAPSDELLIETFQLLEMLASHRNASAGGVPWALIVQ